MTSTILKLLIQQKSEKKNHSNNNKNISKQMTENIRSKIRERRTIITAQNQCLKANHIERKWRKMAPNPTSRICHKQETTDHIVSSIRLRSEECIIEKDQTEVA